MTTDEKLDSLLKSVASIEKRLASMTVKQAAAASKIEPADDADLDGQYGNFAVTKDPPKWEGPSFVGCHLSECSAEFLDSFAGFKLWQAGKEEAKGDEAAKKKAWYCRKDASRAVGWANRIRGGFVSTQRSSDEPMADSGDIPF